MNERLIKLFYIGRVHRDTRHNNNIIMIHFDALCLECRDGLPWAQTTWVLLNSFSDQSKLHSNFTRNKNCTDGSDKWLNPNNASSFIS